MRKREAVTTKAPRARDAARASGGVFTAHAPARVHLFALRLHAIEFTESLFCVTERDGLAEAVAHTAPFEGALDAAGEALDETPGAPSQRAIEAARAHANARAEALAERVHGPLSRALAEAAPALRDDAERWEARREALVSAHRAHAFASLVATVELRARAQ